MKHDHTEAVEDAEQARAMPSAHGSGGYATRTAATGASEWWNGAAVDRGRRRYGHEPVRPQELATADDDNLFGDLGGPSWEDCVMAAARTSDPVASPEPVSAFDRQEGGSHYTRFAIQPAEFLIANGVPWAEGSAIQYVLRWREKGGVQDLRKAVHTLQLLIEAEERKAAK